MPKQILGMHDWDPAWGELLRAAGVGGWCAITEAIGSDPKDDSGRDYSSLATYDITPIVRLNHAYGQGHGTIPKPGRYNDFAARVGNFVRASKGCAHWVIGNETNMPWESPDVDGRPIDPLDYAQCFRFCRDAIKRVQPDAVVMPSPVAPWNAIQGDWIELQRRIWVACMPFDGVALHAYTHGHNADLICSEACMDPPYDCHLYNFRVYKQLLSVVPPKAQNLPAFITEANPDGWENVNNGWIQEAVREIGAHNSLHGQQKIHSLCLYRWPDHDRPQFTICNKAGVIEDFSAAIRIAPSPQGAVPAPPIVAALPVPDVDRNAPMPRPPEEKLAQVSAELRALRQHEESYESVTVVNVRAGAGINYDVMDQLMTGEVVRSIEKDGDWVRIDRGWCATVWNNYTLLDRVASDNWGRALKHILKWEGGYVNDPRDPGGETNFGISKRAYPDLDIANLTREQAVEIYRRDYWMKSGANQLDWPLCLTHLDFAVNAGTWRACKTLEESGGDFARYNQLREDFYRNISGFVHFGAAWLRRVGDAIALAEKDLAGIRD